MRVAFLILTLIFGLLLTNSLGAANLQVSAQASLPSPQPVGSAVALTLSATDTNANPGIVNYKIEVAPPPLHQYQMLHDFSVGTTFTWSRNLLEGTYLIRVTARDSNYPGQTAQTVISYAITPRVTSSQPVISATTHPLVALVSAPPCLLGKSMRIMYTAVGSAAPPFYTNFVACNGLKSMNFLVGGLLPTTKYAFTYQSAFPGGIITNGPTGTWTSGVVDPTVALPAVTFPIPYGVSSSQPERITLISLNTQGTPLAVDTKGHVVWYYAGSAGFASPGVAAVQIMRLITGGSMLILTGYANDYTGTGVYGNQSDHQVLQEIDLTGAVIRETNVDRVNEQLIAMGTDPIATFNHDARRLPNGDTMVIGTVQRVFPAGTQGSTVPIDILGTSLVELDQNFQVVWSWDSFDHDSPAELDINRTAPLNEQCTTSTLSKNGCPPTLLTIPANDWLHTNTLQYLNDGSLLISIRDQDWLAKIDYDNGRGSGRILWKLGNGGDFSIVNPTNDPYPWFSHQHDSEILNSSGTVILFDNGNTRVTANGGNSRGYAMQLNEDTLTATITSLFDLGYYALAQGSAQKLSNGDYMFMGGQILGTAPHSGMMPDAQPPSQPQFQFGAEFTPSGTPVYSETTQSNAYRLWRVPDFYNWTAN